jgi:hypothetical protein
VKIALAACAFGDNASRESARRLVAMVDFLFTLGQAASVMLLIYGAILVLLPAPKKVKRDEMRQMHLRMHA